MVEVMCRHCGATWDDSLPSSRNKYHGKCLKCGRRTREPYRSPTDYQYNALKNYYNATKSRYEWQALIGTEWFVIDAIPSRKIEYEFSGVFDLAAANLVITDRGAMRAQINGVGIYRSIDVLGAALRLTTGAVAGNDNTLMCGDNNAAIHPWNVARDIYYQLHFRLPLAADLAHVYLLFGLYFDANNYIAIRYDPDGVYHAADPQFILVTRSGGVETTTELQVPDNLWHTINIRCRTDSVVYVWDAEVTVTHTTNVPTANMAHYFFIETQENVLKNLDLEHLFVIQDDISF